MTGRPIALTIAGSDSSGGAGIQADLKTFSALGVYGASVISALTAQNTTGVTAVHVPPVAFLVAQMTAVFGDLHVKAIKTGMLASASIVHAVAEELARHPGIPLVVDPVMVATSGDRLLDADAVDAVRTRLIPHAALITPNLPEAAALLDTGAAATLDEAEAQARALLELGCDAVLIKGGHRVSSEATDILVLADGTSLQVSAPWIDTANTHGTGCTLSAAITACLAQGQPLPQAVRNAKAYLTCALEHGRSLRVGQGLGQGQEHGPVDHLFGIRPMEFIQ